MARITVNHAGEKVKLCGRCKETLPIECFYISPKNERIDWACRECTSVYRRDYYEQHQDEIKIRRGPMNREYARRRRQTDPEYRQRSIAAVRAFWNKLSPAERAALNKRKKLLKRYGLSVEQWDALNAAQNGACAICERVPAQARNFHVDHCHKTGRVRGLLCAQCNVALGWFEHVAGRLDRVHEYLAKAADEVPMTDDDGDLPDYVIGGAAPKQKRPPKQTMKPPSAKRNRPVVVKRAALKRKHYARKDR